VSATDAQVLRLRRMVNEPEFDTYHDDDLKTYIEDYPLIDDQGLDPWWIDVSTDPPSRTETVGWIPTYDLNAAAADIWEEKAAVVAQDFDFNADGGNYSRSQVYQQYMRQARFFRARRVPSTFTLRQEPRLPDTAATIWIGNLAEQDIY
jgi:hypothetical protein